MAVVIDPSAREPLTSEELTWAKKLDKLLGQMPSRLKIVEVDDQLMLIDSGINPFESGVGPLEDAGGFLAMLTNGTMKITSMTR